MAKTKLDPVCVSAFDQQLDLDELLALSGSVDVGVDLEHLLHPHTDFNLKHMMPDSPGLEFQQPVSSGAPPVDESGVDLDAASTSMTSVRFVRASASRRPVNLPVVPQLDLSPTDEISPCSSTSTSTRRGRKRSAGTPSSVIAGTPEYVDKRMRNNEAVRKSREKARQRQNTCEKAAERLRAENGALRRRLDSATKELRLLKSLFIKIGMTVPIELRNAIRSREEGLCDEDLHSDC